MNRAILLLLALHFISCGEGIEVVLPLPSTDAKTILVFATVGETVHLFAQERIDGGSMHLSMPTRIDAGEAAMVEMLTYPERAEVLRLTTGKIPFHPDGTPPPSGHTNIYATSIADGQAGSWEVRPDLSARAKSFRLQLEPPCILFQQQEVFLPDDESVLWGVRTTDAALFGTKTAQYLFQDGRLDPIETTPSVALESATRDDKGELWFGGSNGAIYRGTFDGRLVLETIATSTSGRTFHSLLVRHDGPEIIAKAKEKCVERFDGQRWHLLHCFDDDHQEGTGSVAHLDPDRAIAVDDDHQEIVRIIDGTAHVEAWPIFPMSGNPTTAAYLPSFGTVIGTRHGALLASTSAGWEELDNGELGNRIRTLAEFQGAIISGDSAGKVSQYHHDYGVCPQLYLGRSEITVAVTMNDLLLITGDPVHGASQTRISVLRRPER